MNFGIILSQNNTPIFKYIVWVLGKIMEGIFFVLDKMTIPNIGLSIIIFTIIVNICMLPLTYKQQKFSKLSMKMQPEMNAIKKKYEGKKDQDSQLAMSSEMQAVYGKYGVSPTGSCLFLLIQMPILFALYRVIYQMPGYVAKIKAAFFTGNNLVDKIAADPSAIKLLQTREEISSAGMFANSWNKIPKNLDSATHTKNVIIDVLNRASTEDWNKIKEFDGGKLANAANDTLELLNKYNHFLGINISETPWHTMLNGFKSGHIMMGIVALLIPILAGVTQWINVKLTPQQPKGDSQADSMASSMKTMNYIMPLLSVWFCFTLPAGMGLYWIAGAVVRGVIMVILNKKIDKMDYEKLIEKNADKNAKKIAKRKATQEKLNAYASMNTRNISANSNKNGNNSSNNKSNSAATSSYVRRHSNIAKKANNVSEKESPKSSGSSSGGMMAKANAVKNFNEKNNK